MSSRPSTASATSRRVHSSAAALRDAWAMRADPATGRIPVAKLADVLTAAGWDLSSFATGQGQILVRGASPNDALLCLRSIGHSDRSIASGTLTVSLFEVSPWFQARMGGIIGVKNPTLLRCTVGGEGWGQGVRGGRSSLFACSLHPPPPYPHHLSPFLTTQAKNSLTTIYLLRHTVTG